MRKVQVITLCDFCEEVTDTTEHELRVDTATRALDLCEKCHLELVHATSEWLEIGRAVDDKPARRAPVKGKRDPRAAEIRAWALASGYTLSARGRVPTTVRDAWESAHAEIGRVAVA
jgi:hypothetical protein